jgi:hypothetical protein
MNYELSKTDKIEAIKRVIFNRQLSLALIENLPESAVEEINQQIETAKQLIDELEQAE